MASAIKVPDRVALRHEMLEVISTAVLPPVFTAAPKGEVGQCEDCPAMYGAHAVEMPFFDGHARLGVARTQFDESHAAARGKVVVLEMVFDRG